MKLTIWLEPVTVTVDQKRYGGTRLSGTTVGRWDGSGFADLNITADPATIAADVTSTEVLKGWQGIVSNPTEKYRVWERNQVQQLDNVQNHRGFYVDPFLNNLTSRFHPTDNSVSIKTDLLDELGTSAGDIQFHDPWYIDFQDPAYGFNWRNRGMEEPRQFHSRSSGFVPDFAGIFPQSPYPYNGILLNQPIETGKPYYSVGASSSSSIGGFATSFVKWGGDNVTFQNATATQTGVVFTAPGATATALYKAHLGSSTTAATSSNSQRKLVSNDGNRFYLGYESVGDVWMTSSSDGGTTWNPETMVSDGTGNSGASSLAVYGQPVYDPTELGEVYAIYRTQQYPAGPRDLFVRIRTNGVWGSATRLNSPSTPVSPSVDTHPVIARHNTTRHKPGDTQELLAVWEGGVSSADYLKYTTTVNTGSGWDPWATVSDIPYTDNTHRNPSLSSALTDGSPHPLFLTYDNGNDIFIQTFGGSPTGWHDPTTVPASMSPTCSSSQVSADTRDAGHPMVYVVWEAVGGEEVPPPGTDRGNTWGINGATQRRRVMYQKRDGTSWVDAYEFRSTTLDYHHPTVTNLSNGHVVWAWDDGSNTYKSHYSMGLWTNPVLTSGATQPNLALSGTGDPLPATRFVSTSTSGPVYRLDISSQTSRPTDAPQASVVSQQYSRRIVVAKQPCQKSDRPIEGSGPIVGDSASYLSVELAPVTLKMRDGSMVTVDFTGARDSVIDEQSGWGLLASEPVMLSSAIDSIVVCGGAEARAPLALSGSQIGMAFELVDADQGTVLKRIGLERVFNADSMVSFVCKDRIAGLTGRRVFLRPGMRGFEKKRQALVATLVHVYTLTEDSTSKPSAPVANGTTSSLPTSYALHPNYPNPFNPATEIRFDMPEAGTVALVVYDVLGREVAELANGYQEAGYHSAHWNAAGQASGVYFARLSVTNAAGAVAYTRVNKLMLVR